MLFSTIIRIIRIIPDIAFFHQAQAEEESTTIADIFPELTVAQRKFGVNPAFKSYFDPSFKREEGIGESRRPRTKHDVVRLSNYNLNNFTAYHIDDSNVKLHFIFEPSTGWGISSRTWVGLT